MPRLLFIALLVIAFAADGTAQDLVSADDASDAFEPLFNGRDLSGWRNVNTAPSTWQVRDGMIVTTGTPTGELCTTAMYENYVLELEWRHVTKGGNAGLFLHSDPITAVGQPFTRAIEAQVMDGNHGDVFSIHGASMVPDRPHPDGWSRSLPIEERANPAGEWNHYRVESRDGMLTLAVNGKVVSGGTQINPRKGYICLESEGSEAHFRGIRILALPSTNATPEETALTYAGFQTLYTGVDLSGWQGGAPWTPYDWILRNTGSSNGGDHLWSEAAFGNYELIVDFRLDCDDAVQHSAVFLRGSAGPRLPIGCSSALSDGGLPGFDESFVNSRGWQRLHVIVEGNQARVAVGGRPFMGIQFEPDTPERGPIGLADEGAAAEFANLYVRHSDS